MAFDRGRRKPSLERYIVAMVPADTVECSAANSPDSGADWPADSVGCDVDSAGESVTDFSRLSGLDRR